jgi:hypothetical protein
MRRVLIRYRLKPDQVERNEELVRAVYEELHRAAPSGFRYTTFKLEDGVSFMHISESEGEDSPMAGLRPPRSSSARSPTAARSSR